MKWRLYADLGNATLHWGIWAGGEWPVTERVETGPEMTQGSVESFDRMMAKASVTPGDFDGGLMSSSAPATTAAVAAALEHRSLTLPQMSQAHRDAIPCEYYEPAQLGTDRIANAVAAAYLYADPCVVIDIGTCITVEVVSDGVFVGGAIAPGIAVMRAGFVGATAHLAEFLDHAAPPADVTRPGRCTEENILLGIYMAVLGTVEALAERMSAGLKEPEIVLTGGGAAWICDHSDIEARTDPILTLRGLRILDELV